MMQINLLTETIDALAAAGRTPDDVRWVQDGVGSYEWPAFVEVAKSVEYSNGFGGAEIISDLKICGDGWWLERGEYDGSEWWEFKTMPHRLLAGRALPTVMEL